MTEGGEPTGTWSAEPWSEHPEAGADPAPLDLSGIWSSVSRGTHKDSFDLTPAGAAINDAYDETLDDPHLRCVSGGTVRMEDGPFNYEIIDQGDHILILYHYFNESRRIWMDGREFPEGIENAWLPMGYSIGHWEGVDAGGRDARHEADLMGCCRYAGFGVGRALRAQVSGRVRQAAYGLRAERPGQLRAAGLPPCLQEAKS